ncbi:hypothetical protein FSP39_001733 [Pinctada imbricata]|uniref:SWIM-type domain-containing protein n=1 Tax=Pinctada imbricata TaxID=66713 RepID=A0AA88YVM9_PINIB|nr:hypothetical protein FSP39_001733 [Pinctada imbricata]
MHDTATGDLSHVPFLSFGFVEQTIKESTKSDGSKEFTKGYKYFSEKYITDIKVYQLGEGDSDTPGCLVKARSYRSQKKNESPHSLEIVLTSGPAFDRDASKCSCAIGSSGSCGHIAGLLYTLAHMKTTGMKAVPTDVAKTSLPQTWHVPRGEKLAGTASNNVTVQGYNAKNPYKETRGIRSTLYNPIPTTIHNLPFTQLCLNLEKIDKSCLFLTVFNVDDQESNTETKFGKFPKGSPLAVQHKLQTEYILNILDAEDFPKLPVKNFMRNRLSIVLGQQKLVRLESMKVTNEQSAEIESMTQLQSKDPKWHKVRRERVTASIAGDIVKRRKEYEPLVERMRTTRRVITASMRHGIACETIAADAYVEKMNGDVNIYPCGIVVSPKAPWLAASPDRKVYCPSLSPKHGLLEIKCPVNPLSECSYLSR